MDRLGDARQSPSFVHSQPAEGLLYHEFDQAWEHYRHLENSRNLYLNYALTLSLAILAVSIPLIPIVNANPQLLVVASIAVSLYALIVMFTLIGVIKIRGLNNHYHLVFLSIRNHLHAEGAMGSFDAALLSRRRYGGQAIFSRMLNIQSWAEGILLLFLFMASAGCSGLAIIAFGREGIATWHTVMIVALAALALLLLVMAGVLLTRVRLHESAVLSGPHWDLIRRGFATVRESPVEDVAATSDADDKVAGEDEPR